jgi:ATP-binding cassette subfamily B (MDR/TAP) protein 1
MNALVRQEISFFDEAKFSSGGLTSAVSTHPNNVGGATGVVSGQLIVAMANLSGSLLIGLILDWKTALVTVPLLLLLLFSVSSSSFLASKFPIERRITQGWLNISMLEKHEASTAASTAGAASFVNEHVDAVRTVVALGRESETMRLFKARFQAGGTRKRFFFLGTVGFALSYGSVMCIAGVVFYRGSQRLVDGLVSS